MALITTLALAATLFQYTEHDQGPNQIPLGYPVPVPVDSLTPVPGFRSYQALNQRHQSLVDASRVHGHTLGETLEGRLLPAYQFGDADILTPSGATEGAAIIVGGIHAREWQSPEAVSYLLESLALGEPDPGLADYLADSLDLYLVPVLNIDGLLQTQRYPARVSQSADTPREGRMRRKNLHGADNDITTDQDNLEGVDLNRNNSPYWATSSGSSDDPQSLVYHGTGPASEPEIQALAGLATLAGRQRLRLYIDTHSFSQLYFAARTGQASRDNRTDRLAAWMRGVNGNKYAYSPSQAGAGIGTTEEFFANSYDIPAYTLEIEPRQSAAQYGGNGVSHDGFILPEAEVPRMRDEIRLSYLAGLYAVAGPPVLEGLTVTAPDSGQLLYQGLWQGDGSRRQLVKEAGPLPSPGQLVRLTLQFDKPMRLALLGQSGPSAPALGLITPDASFPLDSSGGRWLMADDGGYRRYPGDTFTLDIQWPQLPGDSQLLALAVTVGDALGQQLDSNPASTAHWRNGQWLGYEDDDGDSGDRGGSDRSQRLLDDGSPLFPPPPPPPPSSGGGGGGALSWLLALLGCAGARRKL
ncbi:M14 family zinc carboxypeptidase [Gallaecimonas sp. GXIMD4217]|uniref:M14 family zinc carboxypeptidase n=1 Tax=Gallaecimonas sp. GXIMD4217 TaxID=3131927 RepID=UPI00311ADEC3